MKRQASVSDLITIPSSRSRVSRRSHPEKCTPLPLVAKIMASLAGGMVLATLLSSLLHASFHQDSDSSAPQLTLSQSSALNHISEEISHRAKDERAEEFSHRAEDERAALKHKSEKFSHRAEDENLVLQTGAEEAELEAGLLLQSGVGSGREVVSRVAFGSCTSRREIEQAIWRDGVIASNPQAWIWAGDIAYMDWPGLNCKDNPGHENCKCIRNWLHNNRQTCLSGNISHAKMKLEEQLQNPDYKEFMHYMCANQVGSPYGDLSSCKRPILGTWDDHDYNWQDGDSRLPSKEQQKHLFLDIFGVPFDSPRRKEGRGIYWKHTLNQGMEGKEIDVLLLDERFHRDAKPCHTRRTFCEKVQLPDPNKYKHEWCKDFILGGEDGRGSCCRKDEEIYQGWCKQVENHGHEVWEAACNPKAKEYGSSGLGVDTLTGYPIRRGGGLSGSYDDGVVCEVLGAEQRSWLQEQLDQSTAPLKLVVSGSPAFNSPKEFMCAKAVRSRPAVQCACYDDYDCFRPAQLNLLHSLARAPGCAVVITGDFHFSDIKVLQPGEQSYSEAYDSSDLPHPVFQVMASGLTEDTGQRASCQGYRADKNGFRPGGECSFVSGPAFGMIEVDWETPEKIAKLQVRDNQGVVKLESVIRLDTCTLK